MQHDIHDLILIFNRCFESSFNTHLVRGDGEPIYLPQSNERPRNEIHFAHGYFSSALHEIAHWLIAGAERRKLEDFGYWYEPDGRTAQQQTAFEQVEVKPQAIEWILSRAADHPFYISADNLNGETTDNSAFKSNVIEQVKTYCNEGISERTKCLRDALADFYQTPKTLEFSDFDSSRI